MNSSKIKNVEFYSSNRKKRIRYFRWTVKAIFLMIFIVPVAYLPRGQELGLSSFFSLEATGKIAMFTTIESFFMVPITESPCSFNLRYYGDIAPGFWLMEPFGGLQVLVSGQVGRTFLIQTVVAVLFFVALTVIFGNVFCSWVCPVGTLIDSFDKGIEKFFPNLEAKRVQRWTRRKERKSEKSKLGCPVCPLHKVSGLWAHGILASAVIGSAVFKFPVFCAVCPIGIVSRGLVHFKSMMSITQVWMVWWLEMLAVPIVATLLSLREKRYWCKRICPVGAFLGLIGSLNPFIKPRVKDDRCIMKGCPEDCKGSKLDICMLCRSMDDNKCEKVCPVDIDLVNHGSLARCTKCMECYIVCDYDAIQIDSVRKPDIIQSVKMLVNRLRKRFS
ncbi:MAG: 4Fe-4S binding protein [Candidatus Bathyarchaeota archaeon]|nr:4Fe-4S binding protein [Candidatus Bathyarchaeum sp.]